MLIIILFLDQVHINKLPQSQKANMLLTITKKADDRLFSKLTLELDFGQIVIIY